MSCAVLHHVRGVRAQVLGDRLLREKANVPLAVQTTWVEACWQQGACLQEDAYCFKPLEVSAESPT